MTQENEKLISGGNSRAITPPGFDEFDPDDEIITNQDFVKNGATIKESFGVNSTFEANIPKGFLFFNLHLFTAQGNHLPAHFSLSYSERFNNTNAVHNQTTMFNGWKLNYHQFIRFVESKWVYVDGSFKEHIFEAVSNYSTYYLDTAAQSGAILRPAVDSELDYADYVIFDGTNTNLFFKNNLLVRITQKRGTTAMSTAIYHGANGQVNRVVDGLNNEYFVNYASTSVTITNSAGDTLATMTKTVNGVLQEITYLDGKKCIITSDAFSRLMAIEDQSTCEKLQFGYEADRIWFYKKYAYKNNTAMPLQSTFVTYSDDYTIVSKNKGVDQDQLQIRHKYTFNSDGKLINVCEIDSDNQVIDNETNIDYSSYSETYSTYDEKNKIFNIPDVEIDTTVDSLESVTFFDKTISVPAYYKGSVGVSISWDVESQVIPTSLAEYIVVTCFVDGSKYDEWKYLAADTFPTYGTFELNNLSPGENVNVQLTVSMENAQGRAQIKNIQEYYSPTSTVKMCYQIPETADTPIDDDKWEPFVGLTFNAGIGEYITPDVFTFDDYKMTMTSFVNNSGSGNIYYNDGKRVHINGRHFTIRESDRLMYLADLPVALVSSVGDQRIFDYMVIEGSCLKICQRKYGQSTPFRYTKLDGYLRPIEEWCENAPTITYEYDPFGNLVETYVGGKPSGLRETSTFSEDGQHLVATPNYLVAGAQATYEYNTDGMLSKVTSPKQHDTHYSYQYKNRLSRVSSQSNGLLNANDIAYDGAFITSLTHNGTTFTFSYDNYNNASEVKVANGTLLSRELTYDEDHSGKYSIKTCYSNGYILKNYYDKYNRLVQVCSVVDLTETPLATYIYANNRVHASNASPNYLATSTSLLRKAIDEVTQLVYNYTYDGLGTCTKVEVTTLAGNFVRRVMFVYDAQGRVCQQLSTIGSTIVDKQNTYADTSSSTLSSEQTTVAGLSLSTDYTRNSTSLPTAITKMAGSVGIKQELTYKSRAESSGNVGTTPYVSRVITYKIANGTQERLAIDTITYDSNGNITKYGLNSYKYDELNRLIRENNLDFGKTFLWAYDAGGNIVSKTEFDFTLATDLTGLVSTATHTYTYGSGWKDQLTSFNGQNITYDPFGNPLTYGNKTFSWTRGGLLNTVTLANGSQVVMTYDSAGARTRKTTADATYDYVYTNGSLAQLTLNRNSQTFQLTFVYDSQGVAGFVYNNKLYRYIRNLFGDVTHIYEGDTCITEYTYDAWGNCHTHHKAEATSVPLEERIGNLNPFRYHGYIYDAETGLYYCNNRYYSPEWGRYISSARVSSLNPRAINGLNLYSYARNNPFKFSSHDTRVADISMPSAPTSAHSPTLAIFSNVVVEIDPAVFLRDVLDFASDVFDILDEIDGAAGFKKISNGLGYAVAVLDGIIVMDETNDLAQAAATVIYDIGSMYLSAGLGGLIGTAIGGPAGTIIGIIASVIIEAGLLYFKENVVSLIADALKAIFSPTTKQTRRTSQCVTTTTTSPLAKSYGTACIGNPGELFCTLF